MCVWISVSRNHLFFRGKKRSEKTKDSFPWKGLKRGMNNSVETINAAATAIVAAESRVQQATTVQRRKWGGCLSLYWCFGSPRHGKRIGHAVLVPEPAMSETVPSTTENPTHPPALVLPFVAPPSSPASFLYSEPPSATQSPAGLLSFNSFSANAYSPSGPRSIFAIGPYAHEPQLVSPPVFSAFTTEPSTAPFTPPPELVQLTTPSSPEVPFAKLLSSSLESNQKSIEFQSYQLYPGSPVGHLISPSSVLSGSGTSSPFPDHEFPSGRCSFPPFRTNEPPKLSNIDWFSRKLVSRRDPLPVTADTGQANSQEAASPTNMDIGSRIDELVVNNHRVSFELTADEATACVTNEPPTVDGTASESSADPTLAVAIGDQLSTEESNACKCLPNEVETSMERTSVSREEQRPQSSVALGTAKEFKFDNTEGASTGPAVGSDWWANEKVACVDIGPRTKWSFFPMIQSGVS